MEVHKLCDSPHALFYPFGWLQVVLQVVIAFIVEAFVLQLEQNNRKKTKQNKKILERRISVTDDTDCVEGEQIYSGTSVL